MRDNFDPPGLDVIGRREGFDAEHVVDVKHV